MQIKLLTLDSSEYTLEEQLRKISEEHHEVLTADEENLASEIIDLMQACKTCLERIKPRLVDEANKAHIAKLKQRASEGKIKLVEDGE